MNSKSGKNWTMGIVIAALLAIGSMVAYDMLWGAALVQSTQVPAQPSEQVAPQPQQTITGEDGTPYTVDPDGTVRDAAGNVLGKATQAPTPNQ